jgi:hypothetical protein
LYTLHATTASSISYPSIEAGMESTMSHFLAEAERLAVSKKWTVLVHPIVPVLDETRPVVVAYNRLLKQKVHALTTKLAKAKSGGQGGGASVTWVNGVFDELLTTTSSTGAAAAAAAATAGSSSSSSSVQLLDPCYKLDGTHLHPRYVTKLLAPAIAKALSASSGFTSS